MLTPVCVPEPLVLGCTSCATHWALDPLLLLWALLMLLLVLGTALSVLSASRRVSRVERRLRRHLDRQTVEESA